MNRKTAASIRAGIGLQNERSLHAAIKEWYSRPDDRFEVMVDNYVVDIVRDDVLIEIQTKNLSAIHRKLRALIQNHPVRLVYPIPEEKWIVRVSKSGEKILSSRKSPKRGKLSEIFEEVVYIPGLLKEDHFTLEVLMIQEEEVRCDDGKGSWWRKGVSIVDRRLIDVVEQIRFSDTKDFGRFLPRTLAVPFTNKMLAEERGESVSLAQKMTYCLKKMGLLKEVGKKGNELLFEIVR
ncbi:MAG: hypothetical protein JSV84_02230 [Gemmatimonadota bacterium]|nr:MAG: hypothetical protein JSV84_02230 [Gemmatimonadota bacterium]